MAQIVKQYINHFGLDLKNSDLVRQDQFASDMKNAQYDKDGAVEKRKGFQAVAASEGGHGLFTYNLLDTITASRTRFLLSVSDTLHKLQEATFTITYTPGTAATSSFDFFFDPDTDQYRAQITEDGTNILDEALGIGFDELTPVTLADLKTAVDALTDYAATITGTTTIPAAFLTIRREIDLIADPSSQTAREWVDVNTSTDPLTPFAGSETNKNDDDFENVTSAQVNNCVYISNGYDFLQKFDGQTVYRAGMPQPDAPSIADAGAGSIADGVYLYAQTFEHRDNAGNLVEGDISATTSFTVSGGPKDNDVTYDNITSTNTDASGDLMVGFNDHCAIAVGAQVSVNIISIDDGSSGGATLLLGDKAYFFDSISGGFVTRNITAASGSSITIDGAAVTIADNAVISNDLRVNIYRSDDSGTFLFLVSAEPNNAFATTSLFTDDNVSPLGTLQFIPPDPQNHGLPPKGRYVATFNNFLTIAGNLESPDTWFFSSADHPEFFPTGNNLLVQANINDRISGISQNDEVFAIFKERSVHIVSGDITFLNVRVDTLTKDIGCVAHHTIQEVRGALYFLSDRGVYSITNGQQPIERSTAIEPIFNQDRVSDDDKFNTKRAIGVNHRADQQYILFLPVETVQLSEKTADLTKTLVFTEDYFREAQLKWSNLDFMGGATIFEEELYFSERRLSAFISSVDHILYKQMSTGDAYDYQDNTIAVDFEYKTNWYKMGQASVFKKFLWAKLFIKDVITSNNFMLDLSTEINFVEGLVKTIKTFSESGTGGYGVSPYGTAAYGDVEEAFFRVKLKSGKAKALRLIFANNDEQQNVALNGWELAVGVPYDLEIKE